MKRMKTGGSLQARVLARLAGSVFACGSGVAALLSAAPALAQPSGGTVVSGTATIQQSGGTTTITTGHQTIINWGSFNIPTSYTVQFIQPGSTSTVLNRVTNPDPTYIHGTLLANGRVFIVNPAGVIFGANAFVNVGQLYAAAGHISDKDFLAGNLRFSGLRGSVENHGALNAQSVALLGQHVLNSGVINAPAGLVMMIAGNDAYIGQRDGQVFARVQVDETGRQQVADGRFGVSNTGTIDARGGQIVMAASDFYAHAIFNSGTLRASDIRLESGAERGAGPSLVQVGGLLDASNPDGVGGSVVILGDRVHINDARINVSGAQGGGRVLIGGPFRGGAEERTASRVFVSDATLISADALTRGSGGQVVIWSDEATAFAGRISARGGAEGGDGGLAEVSSRGVLAYRGFADLRAPMGRRGTLLLDPKFIIIQSGGADPLAGNVLFGDNPSSTVTIDPLAIIAALDGANLVLQANTDIIVNSTINALGNADPGDLTLRAGRSILINADIIINGVFTAIANDNSIDVVTSERDPGPGEITMADGTLISTNGHDIVLQVLGGVLGATDAGNITISTLNAGAGNVLLQIVSETPGASILRTDDSVILANAAALRLVGPAGGTIGTAVNPINVNVGTLALGLDDAGQGFIASPARGLTIGSVTAGGITVDGVELASGASGSELTLNIAGALGIEAPVRFGSGTLRITTLGGVSQTAAGRVTGSSIGIVNLSTTEGDIDLTAAPDNEFGTVAVLNNNPGGSVRLRSAGPLTVGTITSGTTGWNSGNDLSGIVTTPNAGGPFTNDVLVRAGGALQIDQEITAPDAVVRLSANGGVAQSGGGLITAGHLGVVNSGSGNINLDLANRVGALTAANGFPGGFIFFRNEGTFRIATLASIPGLWVDPIVGSRTTLLGVQAADQFDPPFTGNITLISDTGSLDIDAIIATDSGDVRLQAATGISQSVGATISAFILGAVNTTSGSINLSHVNAVGNGVALFNASTAPGDGIVFRNSGTFVVTQLTDNPAAFNGGNDLVGVVTSGDNDILLASVNSSIEIHRQVNAGGGTVRLLAATGISQNADGIITAANLGAINTALTDIDLRHANQISGQVTFVNRANNGGVIFRNDGSFTVGQLSTVTHWADPNDASGAQIRGITATGNAAITLNSGPGSILIDRDIVGSNATLRIQTGSGLSQSETGILRVRNVGLVNTGSGDIILDQSNAITNSFAAHNLAPGGEILLLNNAESVRTSQLLIDRITGVDGLFSAGALEDGDDVDGLKTADGNITILLEGSMRLNRGIDAGSPTAGGIIRLQTGRGIEQPGLGTGGEFTQANAVRGRVLAVVNDNPNGATTGRAAFFNNFNNVGTLTGRNENAGADVSLFNIGDLIIGELLNNTGRYARFNGGEDLVGVRNGGGASGGSQIVSRLGSLTITRPISLGEGGGYFQGAHGVTQTAEGIITAKTLVVRNEARPLGSETGTTTGNIDLFAANVIGTSEAPGFVAMANLAPGGSIRFYNTRGIELFRQENQGLVRAIGFQTTNNESGDNTNDILIVTEKQLLVADDINAGGGIVRLQAATGISQEDRFVQGDFFNPSQFVPTTITARSLSVLNTTSGDIFLDGTNAVQFFSGRNNAPGATLAFANANTQLRFGGVPGVAGFNNGDPIEDGGISVFTTDGGRMIFGSQAAVVLTQPLVNNGGDIILQGPVILGQDGDNVINTRFTGGYTYDGGGRVIIGGNISVPAGEDNTRSLVILTPVGPEVAGLGSRTPAVVFGGSQIGTADLRLANILINADNARTSIPSVATVIFGANSANNTTFGVVPNYNGQVFVGGNITLGQFERTSVPGSITFGSAAQRVGSITLGDLTVTGNTSIFADLLTFMLRPGGPNLLSGEDDGLSLVFGGSLALNDSPLAFTGSGSATVTSTTGNIAVGNLVRLTLGELITAAGLLTFDQRGFFSLARVGFQRIDLASALPGGIAGLQPAPVQPLSVGDAASGDAFRSLLIQTRDVTGMEVDAALTGSGIIVDVPTVERPQPLDFKVAPGRLSATMLRRIADLYARLLPDDSVGTREAIAAAVREAWADFAAERRYSPARSPLEFRAWLEERVREGTASPAQAGALRVLDAARDLFAALEQTGLTRAETLGPRVQVLSILAGGWLPGSEYDALQTAVTGASPLAMR